MTSPIAYVVRAQRLNRDVGQVETISPAKRRRAAHGPRGRQRRRLARRLATLEGAAAPGVAAVIRPAGARTCGAPQLVLAGADVGGTAAGAIAPGSRAVVAGGQAEQIGRQDPRGVRVTQLIG